MTSRRAFKHHEQKLARVLQFEPGHVGGRVASAQPVNRLGGTVRGSVVGAAGNPIVGGPGVLTGIVTATATTSGGPVAVHPLAGTLSATTATVGTITTATTGQPLAGVVTAATTVTGSMGAVHPLASTVTATSAVAGSIGVGTGGGWGPDQSAYTTQAPTENQALGGFSLGNDFTFAVAGRITGMRLYSHTGFPSTPQDLSLWSNTGTKLAQAPPLTVPSAGWWPVLFTTPVAVTAGQTVRGALTVISARALPRRPNFAADVVNGDVTMLKQAFFLAATTTAVYPTTTTANTYFVDVIFQKAL